MGWSWPWRLHALRQAVKRFGVELLARLVRVGNDPLDFHVAGFPGAGAAVVGADGGRRGDGDARRSGRAGANAQAFAQVAAELLLEFVGGAHPALRACFASGPIPARLSG